MLQRPNTTTNLQAIKTLARHWKTRTTRATLAEALRRVWGPDYYGIYKDVLTEADRILHERDELPTFAKVFVH